MSGRPHNLKRIGLSVKCPVCFQMTGVRCLRDMRRTTTWTLMPRMYSYSPHKARVQLEAREK